MSNSIQNMDELLECAIREKGAMERMSEMDRKELIAHRRRLQYFAYGAAACVVIAVCTDISLSTSARKAGFAFDPTYGQMGGSEITALMQEKKIDEAMLKIDGAVMQLEAELDSPSSQDPEYTLQLKNDREELDLLEAVCLMRKGKYFKAKKALKDIVKGQGSCSYEAAGLIENML